MNTRQPRTFFPPLRGWPIAAATVALTACAAPYPQGDPMLIQARAPEADRRSPPGQDYRRRDNERLYEADITSVRAVMGPGGQHCWIERESVAPQRPEPNVPGAIIGGVLGGILGHQIGGGTGKDIATAGGAVAGVLIGSSVGNDRYGNPVTTREVQRCSTDAVSSEPAYWDVVYRFRGVTHHVQMRSPPQGRGITVNEDGDPRD